MTVLKNTYVVKITPVSEFFEQCDSTKFSIITINGQGIQQSSDFTEMKDFPNPAANFMARSFNNAKEIIGENLAQTIVEYLDKDTKEPVLILFPTNTVMKKINNAEKRLNTETMQDFLKERKIRTQYLTQSYVR